jgi:hypothetical protein
MCERKDSDTVFGDEKKTLWALQLTAYSTSIITRITGAKKKFRPALPWPRESCTFSTSVHLTKILPMVMVPRFLERLWRLSPVWSSDVLGNSHTHGREAGLRPVNCSSLPKYHPRIRRDSSLARNSHTPGHVSWPSSWPPCGRPVLELPANNQQCPERVRKTHKEGSPCTPARRPVPNLLQSQFHSRSAARASSRAGSVSE